MIDRRRATGGEAMTATAVQAWVVAVGALLTGALGILKYFNYRTHRDRVSVVGQAFSSTVEGLSSDAEAKKLAAAILLRRFFDEETEQGAAGTPYKREAVAVIAALLRNTKTGELQKLVADGLAYASSLQGADLQQCNLSRAYLGQRPRAIVTHGGIRLLSGKRRAPPAINRGRGDRLADSPVTTPIDLTTADLFGADLTGASLRSEIARNAVFYTAIARGTVFEGAHLEGADFRQADLRDARFAGAWIEGARFGGAQDLPTNVAALLDQSGQVRPGEGMPVPPV
jgi:Pentapeptide repeats (8 copies)